MLVQRPLLDVGPMVSAPETDGGRRADDNYPTPRWCTDLILPHLPTAGVVIEPSCGAGAILRRLAAWRPQPGVILGVELHAGRASEARAAVAEHPRAIVVNADFLHWAPRAEVPGIGLVIGNPPFSLAIEFVEACLALARPTRATVAMLLRLAFAESRERAAFHRAHPADVYPLAKRPSFTDDGATDGAAVAWWVWGPGRGGRMHAPLLSATDAAPGGGGAS